MHSDITGSTHCHVTTLQPDTVGTISKVSSVVVTNCQFIVNWNKKKYVEKVSLMLS